MGKAQREDVVKQTTTAVDAAQGRLVALQRIAAAIADRTYKTYANGDGSTYTVDTGENAEYARMQQNLALANAELKKSQENPAAIRGEMQKIVDTEKASAKERRNQLNISAQTWKDAWGAQPKRWKAESSSDPFAVINLEQEKALAEAAKADIGSANQAYLDDLSYISLTVMSSFGG
jgi:hypothetical protein